MSQISVYAELLLPLPLMEEKFRYYRAGANTPAPHGFRDRFHIHILCTAGSMAFSTTSARFETEEGDLAIWQMANELSDFAYSEDFEAQVLLASPEFLREANPEMVWATKGYVFLRMNPVIHLSDEGFSLMAGDFDEFRRRSESGMAYFRKDTLPLLFSVFLYDLWEVCMKEMTHFEGTDIKSRTFFRFLSLVEENCIKEREVAFYAEKLNITPKYLSEISKELSNYPASSWIESYTSLRLKTLLDDRRLSLTEIADRLNFSSMSFFTRYVKRAFGMTPKAYRK